MRRGKQAENPFEIAVRLGSGSRPVKLRFGHAGFWSGTIDVPSWGKKCALLICNGLSAEQLNSLKSLLNHPRSIRSLVEKAIYRHYQENEYGKTRFTDRDGNDLTEEHAPKLTSSRQIWNLVDASPGSFCIDAIEEDDEAVRFKLNCRCSWDEEHGLEIEFKDWKIVRIGGRESGWVS